MPHAGYKTVLAALGMAVASTLMAHAQLINIANTQAPNTEPASTGYMSGSALLGTTPTNTTDYWNTLDPRDVHSFTNLVNAYGDPTNVSLSVTGFQGENFSGGDSVGGLAPAIFENFGYEFLANGGTSTLSFSGLADNQLYQFALYNLNDSSHADTTYKVGNFTSTLEQVGYSTYTSNLTNNPLDPGLVYKGNYILLEGTSSATGDLLITMGVAPSNTSNGGPQPFSYMAFDGIQIQAIPEPNTLALLAGGLASLVFFARSRRGLRGFRG